jgi:homoserine O-acetyltransferase
MARKLGLLSYRSMDEWRHRFGRDLAPGADLKENPFGIHFEVESYLDYNSRKFIGGFDANSYLYLSRAMDLFDLANHGRSMNDAVSRLGTKNNLVMGVESDYLFPPFQQQEMADRMRQAGRKVRYHCLPCQHGHDSFLVDSDQFGPVVADFFS